ncbi:uncharacterized protein LOC110032612 [Phalaenopsis equestris]|uniref:uncharacterized protein LOC110032612 n=1 Tax=Phalaenopsis equestris TaxID=78828 RepID=UPI0009E1CBC5|nr:uncharacterized protein LOC110032612 [Phalaenopsis equestris]
MANPCIISGHSRSPASVVVRAVSSLSSNHRRRFPAALSLRLIRGEIPAMEKLGIIVERNPPESKLLELGVKQWPKWGCPPSKFPWTYSAKETCYFLEGRVKVYPEGCGDEYVEIKAGDFVVFPEGMTCTWDVSETVDKHYDL